MFYIKYNMGNLQSKTLENKTKVKFTILYSINPEYINNKKILRIN